MIHHQVTKRQSGRQVLLLKRQQVVLGRPRRIARGGRPGLPRYIFLVLLAGRTWGLTRGTNPRLMNLNLTLPLCPIPERKVHNFFFKWESELPPRSTGQKMRIGQG